MNSAEIAFPNIGIYIPHLPKGITIGGFTIAFYGMIIADFGLPVIRRREPVRKKKYIQTLLFMPSFFP